MRERLATLKAGLDGLSRPKWDRQKAEIDLLVADIEHEEGIERSQRKKAEAEQAAQEEALLKEQMRQRSLALANLGETMSKDYEDAANQIAKVWTKSGNLFDEVCDFDFRSDPEFIKLFRPDYHVHQLCRCLTTRGFRPIIDAIKDFHPGPLPDEVKMADYLRGTVMGDTANDDAAPTNDGGVDK
jgi:hypothetical protein